MKLPSLPAKGKPHAPSDGQAVDLLRRMVETYSPSTHEREVALLLRKAMADWGFDAHIDEAGNAVGILEPAGRAENSIVLLGHIDTVPGRIPVRLDGDVLYGRGSVDAKGPMATFVCAAARAAATRAASAAAPFRIVVIGAVEEETATSKGAYYASTRYRPDYCVIGEPSAWNRVTLGYKGRLLIDYQREREMSHTAGEARGVCEAAVDYWSKVVAYAEAFNADRTGRFATLDPSLRTINSSGDGLTERVCMSIGLRLPLGLDIDALSRQATEVWPEGAQVALRGREVPYCGEKRSELTSAFLTAIRAQGGRAAFVFKTGTSDMNVLGPRWRCPIVAYGPGDSSLDHTPDEHIHLSEYLAAIRVLTRVLERIA